MVLMGDLLPCPFCGGEPDEYEGEYGNGIYCMECGAMVGEPIHLGFDIAERVSYEQAVEAWNTRAERTCKLVRHGSLANMPSFVCWSCSECGFGWHHSENDNQFSYCPNCGAMVVSE